ncbi:PRC-barrel domain-containing protein [Aquitalea magnusonii]|uniref:PRC-barrel domain protein n=1 Tax=Aquitalea magnusonii TaxID=332411 RepID=A0A318JFE5_9NEIS|nr:PRC-barrel domain-containing protein [Aquitalea magnusonii]PXX45919.1 PRC-barrel domain protein [Aquitalea magnusonii]
MNQMQLNTDGSNRTSSNTGGPGPYLMGANTLTGDAVLNQQGEVLGDIKEIMLNVSSGRVAYAVLAFGGFMGLGEKLFAVPWQALVLDPINKRFMLNISKERFTHAPGFDKDQWPDMADPAWAGIVHDFYGTDLYSE